MKHPDEYSHLFTLDPTRNYPRLVRGEGVYVYDDQGKQYLDAIAGILLPLSIWKSISRL